MRPALLLVLLAVVTGCTPRPEPERAVIRYVELIREGRCDDAVRQLSSRMRAAMQAEAEARAREPELANPPAPAEAHVCNRGRFDRVKLRRTRSAPAGENAADVWLVEAQPAGHLVPGFWSTRTDYVEMPPIRAVREDGTWRVEDPPILETLERQARHRAFWEEVRRQVRRR